MKNGIGKYNKHYYTGNHLSSTQLVTDGTGVAVQQVEYSPFGEVVNEYNIDWSSGQVPDFKFNGKELDEENGMYYFEARYQSPPVFISRDPLFEKYPTLSPYSYCANNPVKYIDPTGMIIDPAGEEEENAYNDYKNTVNNKIQYWQNKIEKRQYRLDNAKTDIQIKFRTKRLESAKKNLSTYTDIQNELSEMEQSPIVFKIRMGENLLTPAPTGGNINYNVENDEININVGISQIFNTMQILSHELVHGYQYLNCDLDFDKSGLTGGLLYDQTDEIAAYTRQNLFAGFTGKQVNPTKYVKDNYANRPKNAVSWNNFPNRADYDKGYERGAHH
jgi:RHS repeat-associated protein